MQSTAAPAAAAPLAAAPTDPATIRLQHCSTLATGADPAAGEREATDWLNQSGGFLAHQCLGLAYAAEQRWPAAGGEFESAARGAEAAHDARTAGFWAQAGNAWIAGGDGARAKAALDAAIARGTLIGQDRGEVYLDRARAFVAIGNTAAARSDLDRATVDAAGDPLAWLLSATLARRGNDLTGARRDIDHAVSIASDDPSVQLENGNIAAREGHADAARTAWTAAAAGPAGDPAAASARAALAQFATAPAAGASR